MPHRTVSFEDFFKTASHATRPEIQQHDEARRALLDEVFEGSKLLKTIDPMDKTSNACLMAIAQKAIREASIVYILGYGFDEQNPERLNYPTGYRPIIVRPSCSRIFATATGSTRRLRGCWGWTLTLSLPQAPPAEATIGGRICREEYTGYVSSSRT